MKILKTLYLSNTDEDHIAGHMACGNTYEEALDVELWTYGISKEDYDIIESIMGENHVERITELSKKLTRWLPKEAKSN